MAEPVRLLARSDVETLLDLEACMAAVERGFRARAEGGQVQTGVLGLHVSGGGFHVKAAIMAAGDSVRLYFAAKLNANFPQNPAQRSLPTIQGVLALFDASTGTPLCLMDSIGITVLRTAAATGVAARHLAVPGAGTATIVGCGAQAEAQLAAVAIARPLVNAFVHDLDPSRAGALARAASARLGIPVQAVDDLAAATRQSQIVVTCTPSREPYLGAGHLAPGAFVAAVGADSESKSEIEPSLMAAACVIADSLDQCAAIGDLHHAVEQGAMRVEDVRAELGDVIADPGRGRRDAEEIVVFDSTGVALQDVAAAALVYEAAEERGVGMVMMLGG